ncbi:DUF1214 domain-containing protein [bacterium]|nr:DUF1214 domain-containing protein [bacterium]
MARTPHLAKAAPGGRRSLPRLLATGVLGVALGLGLLWTSLRASAGSVRNGPWRTDLDIGSTAAGPLTRARIAVGGLLALRNTEAIYFHADTDDEGRTLDGRCDYRVEGRDPGSAWWSVTLYDDTGYLLRNEANRWSVSRSTVARGADGSFSVRVSPTGDGPGWLPSPASGPFNLTLRCYEPGEALRADPGAADLPRIVRGGCR